eukprot:7709920-Pyramimonas_sp.AAC.1
MWVTGPRLDRDGRRASLHTSTLQGKYAACTRVGGEARTSAVYEQYGVCSRDMYTQALAFP